MKEIMKDLKNQIADSIQCNEDPEEKSWQYETGILYRNKQRKVFAITAI